MDSYRISHSKPSEREFSRVWEFDAFDGQISHNFSFPFCCCVICWVIRSSKLMSPAKDNETCSVRWERTRTVNVKVNTFYTILWSNGCSKFHPVRCRWYLTHCNTITEQWQAVSQQPLNRRKRRKKKYTHFSFDVVLYIYCFCVLCAFVWYDYIIVMTNWIFCWIFLFFFLEIFSFLQ